MIAGLYLLYAFVQAILFTRFVVKDPDPVPAVIVAFLFAPVITVGLACAALWVITEALARPR
jgi:hypothetical protein